MKKFLHLLFTLSMMAVAAKAQHVLASPIIEKTIAGNQYGGQLLLETKSQWGFGVFYLKSLQRSEGGQSYYPFYGASLNAPLIKSGKIHFFLNVRAGFVNTNFFVIAPGFETRLAVTKSVSLSLLSSIRMQSPSTALRINIKL
ncbi:MAG TPA: hypothetical protein DGG95_12885 [Cytophagales bacterium]|jgi:hypothetical protein|nr:hypothetical protein [Cytophagales bacterium]